MTYRKAVFKKAVSNYADGRTNETHSAKSWVQFALSMEVAPPFSSLGS